MRVPICLCPFNSLYITFDWDVKFCCVLKKNIWNIKNDSLENIINSKKAIEIRNKLMNWKFPNECKTCNEYLKSNTWIDYRIDKNNSFLNNDIYKSIFIWDEIKLDNIYKLTIEFSNQCNFSCIMCSSKFSSSRNYLDRKIFKRIYKQEKLVNLSILDIKKLVNLNSILIKWWEPLIQKEQFEFIKLLIENKISRKIWIWYVSNLSVLPWINWYENILPKWFKNVFDMLKFFKFVSINASCDWYWEVNDKIRIWWKFEKFIKNLDLLIKNKVIISVRITVQIDNLFSIPNLIEYFIIKWIDFDFWIVTTPEFLNIWIIPQLQKDKIIKYYFEKKKQFLGNKKFVDSLDIIINNLNYYKSNEELYKQYIIYSKIFDEYYKKINRIK